MTSARPRSRTYLCAPLAATGGLGNSREDRIHALECARGIRRLGESVVDFAFYATLEPGWLDDSDPEDRRVGLECGRLLMSRCDRVRVFLPPGCAEPTPGMLREIGVARYLWLPVLRGLTGEEWPR